MSDLCECFPPVENLAVMAQTAQTGSPVPFVGTGDPDTVLSCVHGAWRLGDVTAPPVPACTELTKAGEPCKGTPGPDGLCAAHKPKGDDAQEDAGGEEGPGA